MPHSRTRILSGVFVTPLGLSVCFAQEPLAMLDHVTNWPAPLYWQAPSSSHRDIAHGRFTLQTETAQSGVPAVFVAITPCRLADTRMGSLPFGAPALAAGETRVYPVPSGPCNLPAGAVAYSFNIAVVPTGATMRVLTAWPDGDPQPTIATMNDRAGLVTSNAAIVAAGTNGAVDIYITDATNLIIDVNGYYALPSSLHALFVSDIGTGNTAAGLNALVQNTGTLNTALGNSALQSNTAGSYNTATGYFALSANTTGTANTATGDSALFSNTTGCCNTATGSGALKSNTTGSYNTASGSGALLSNTTGGFNTAAGVAVLNSNTTGSYNTASGEFALQVNKTGSNNTATGGGALLNNVTGNNNTATGVNAMQNNGMGGSNIAVGFDAGFWLTGSNNIDIGNVGVVGESNIIRIGTNGTQTSTFVAGINGAIVLSGALPVFVDSNGQLGTQSSSLRYKEDIRDMADSSSGILKMRPVTFRYKKAANDGSKPIQYGLIAEDVAQVNPDIVIYDQAGQPEAVQYHQLNAMLVNELQKQHKQIEDLTARLVELEGHQR